MNWMGDIYDPKNYMNNVDLLEIVVQNKKHSVKNAEAILIFL